MFQDYFLHQNLDKYEVDTILQGEYVDVSSQFLTRFLANYLSKEQIQSKYQDHHRHYDVVSKQFFNEFPRKQTNNDLQYHNEDDTLKFIVDWFLQEKKK